jgi:RHS repeat-associated protein
LVRLPEPGGQAGWFHALATGLSDEQFIADVVGSDEYFSRAQLPVTTMTRAPLLVPGRGDEDTTVTISFVSGDTAYQDEEGVYFTDGEGRVGGLGPDDPGYAKAALTSPGARVLFAQGAQTAGGNTTLSVPGGTFLAFYLIQNSTTAHWLSRNSDNRLGERPLVFFSLPNANPDHFDHVHVGSGNTFAFEDLTGGGDQDFNDAIVSVQFSAPCDFDPNLTGWSVAETGGSGQNAGSVTVVDRKAVLREGNSFNVTLSTTFAVPDAPSTLSFEYSNLDFDTSDPSFIKDAFEVALIDAQGHPLVGTFTSGRDAFFNVTEGLPVATGANTRFDGQTVDLDLSQVPAGTESTLIFRLVNNDTDTRTSVEVDCVMFPTGTAIAPGSAMSSGSLVSSQLPGDGRVGGSAGDASTLARSNEPSRDSALLTGSGRLLTSRSATDSELQLTAEGAAEGFAISTFASGFATTPSGVPGVSPIGPLGIGFPDSGGVLVSDIYDNLWLFPTNADGQSVEGMSPVNRLQGRGIRDLAKANGHVYLALSAGNGGLLQLIDSGTSFDTIINSLPALGLAANPIPDSEGHQHLFVSAGPNIWDVDPIAQTVALFVHQVNFDGLSTDGLVLYGATGNEVLGYQISSGQLVFDSGPIPGGTDGTALGTGSLVGNIFVNTNSAGVWEVNLSTRDRTQIADGDTATRGDFVKVDPDGSSLLVTQSDEIDRLIPPPGGGFGDFRLTLNASAPLTTLSSETDIIISGSATSVRPSDGATQKIVNVTVNNAPVDVLDAGGNFFTQVHVSAGENTYRITATDAIGQTSSVSLILTGVENSTREIDFSQFSDISPSFAADYARTSFNDKAKSLFADVAIENKGQYPANAPLFVGVTNISDPTVRVLDRAGTTPGGIPYYDFTSLVTGGRLSPTETTGTLSLSFFDPNRSQFSYDLVFFGILNRPPEITSVPGVEALVGRAYQYDVNATDPDMDTLHFSLVTARPEMSIDSGTGLISWTPAEDEKGNGDVTVRVDDGRGGTAEQHYIVTVIDPPPNRPPYFTSSPVVAANVNVPYTYQATAKDPDNDPLTFSAVSGPSGLNIDPETGLVTWTPTAAQSDGSQSAPPPDPTLPSVPGFDVSLYANVTDPATIAFGPLGNLFAGRDNSGSGGGHIDPVRIHHITPRGLTVEEYGDVAVTDPDAVAVDSSGSVSGVPGSVLVGGNELTGSAGRISAIFPDQTVHTMLGPSDQIGNVSDLLFDNASRLLFVNDAHILAFDGANLSTLVTESGGFQALAVDSQNRIFVSDLADGGIRIYSSDGTLINGSFATGLGSTSIELAFGPGGVWGQDLYVCSAQTGQLLRFDANGQRSVIGTNFGNCEGMRFGPDGALYLAIFNQDQIVRIGPTRARLGLGANEQRVVLAVSDGRGGSAIQTYTICVEPDPGNHSPVIVSQPITSLVVGAPYRYPVQAVDPDNDVLNYSLVAGPPGMTIDAGSGLVSWDPTGTSTPQNLTFDDGSLVAGFGPDAVDLRPPKGTGPITDQFASRGIVFSFDSNGVAYASSPAFVDGLAGASGGNVLAFDSIDRSQGSSLVAQFVDPATGSPGTVDGSTISIFVSDTNSDPGPRVVVRTFSSDGQVLEERELHTLGATLSFSGGRVARVELADNGGDGFTVDDFSFGPVTVAPADVTVRVDDGRGGFDTQSYILTASAGVSAIHGTKFDGTSSSVQTVIVAESDFDDGLDGWTAADPAQIDWIDSGGNPNGFLRYTQVPVSGPAFVRAPASFDGDWSALNGHGTLSFDQKVIDPGPNLNGIQQREVQISGPGGSARWTAPPPAPVPSDWLTFAIPIVESNWQVTSGTWLGLLQNVTDLRIKVELFGNASGSDISGLDNVRLSGVEAPTLAGWTIYLDDNRNGHLDSGEHSTVTDSLGNYSFENLPAGTYIVAEVPQAGWTEIFPDSSTYTVTVEDGEIRNAVDFGNARSSASTNRDPVVSSTPALGGIDGTLYRYNSMAADPDGDALSFDLPVHPDGMTVQPETGVVVWLPTSDQIGTHDVVLRVEDGQGGVALQSFQITVSAANTPPVITSTPPTQAVEDFPVEYRVRAQDAEQSVLAYHLASGPDGMILDETTGILAWTPNTSQLGPQHVRIVVDDLRGGNSSQDFDLQVVQSAADQEPVISSRPPTSTWLGQSYVYMVEASDPDADPVAYALTTAPDGMSVDGNGIITWNPSASELGSNSVHLVVTDGRGGTAEQDFAVEVTQQGTNRPPVITSNPPLRATVGRSYVYNLAANDPDNNSVLWSLTSGPLGMSLDSVSGTIRWTPTDEEMGPQTVTVTLRDSLFAEATQRFTIQVSCVDLPPVISSRPPTVGAVETPYFYPVRATDPEGDPLHFTFLSSPDGMTVDSQPGLIRWTPTASEAGANRVVVEVDDGQGNLATQTFDIQVSSVPANRPPVITSTPALFATVDSPYSYQVTASDPDGETVSFSLLSAPDGMTIDQASGLVQWTATAAQVPNQIVSVAVTDPRGGQATQSFEILVQENLPPSIDSMPVTTVTGGALYRYDVRASDPNHDPLTYSLAVAPDGMTIDQFGRIRWATRVADVGSHSVQVIVTDPDGASDMQSFDVDVLADTQAPNVTVYVSSSVVQLASTATFRVVATDNVGVASMTLMVGDMPVALDAAGQGSLLMAAAGLFDVVATATDAAGNTGRASMQVRVMDPSDTQGPDVEITRLDMLTAPGQVVSADPRGQVVTVSYLTDVIGTVHVGSGALDSYKVFAAREDLVDTNSFDFSDPDWQQIGQGQSEVADAKLATFDPTMLTDDRYVIAVEAFDTSGQGTIKAIEVDVTGNAKLGEFTLQYTDLSIPLAGIPIQVTRIYDTRQAGEAGDFGFGWRLGIADGRFRETVPQVGDGFFTTGAAFRPGTKVYMTDPDGNRVGFTFTPEIHGSFLGAYYLPKFTPDPGVYDTLEVDATPLTQRGDGTFGVFLFGFDYNPDTYTLVTPAGLRYQYDQFAGLQKVTDLNGNFLTFRSDGIFSSTGGSVQFVRDGQNRITQVIDPAGNAIHYRYDANGDLVSVTDQANQETEFFYGMHRAHYLDKVLDSLMHPVVRTDFDDQGRIVSQTDAMGNAVTQSYDLNNFQETVRDRRGFPTVIEYNDRGNVVSTTDPETGVPTLYEYNDPNNPDKETRVTNRRHFSTDYRYDARGNQLTLTDASGTTSHTYNDHNEVTSVTDMLGRVTRYQYDTGGNLTMVVNAVGNTNALTYDSEGQATSYTDFLGHMTSFVYTGGSHPTTIINPEGGSRTLTYNEFGQLTDLTDEEGHHTHNEYDAIGRLTLAQDGLGHGTRYFYAGPHLDHETDALGHTTSYTYFDNNTLEAKTDPNEGTTSYQYDAEGNLISLTDPDQNVTHFQYDRINRLLTETDSLQNVTSYQYDHEGNRTQIIDGNGQTRTFDYDALNHLVDEVWREGGAITRTISFSYDMAGNLLSESDPDSSYAFSYDSLNRLVSVDNAGTLGLPHVVLTYGYDANGNETSVSDNSGVTVASSYGSRNELLTRTWQGGGIDPARVDFGYYGNGAVKTIDRFSDLAGSALVAHSLYQYDPAGRLTDLEHTSAVDAVFADYQYTYSPTNLLDHASDHGVSVDYGYDATGQLTGATYSDSRSEFYHYDSNGNRTSSYLSTHYEVMHNQTLSDDHFLYTYDGDGNLSTKTDRVSGNVTTYRYDLRNRLVSVVEKTSAGVIINEVEYKYDVLDRRISQTLNGETLLTVYEGQNVWADFDVSGAVKARYLLGNKIDQLLARFRPGEGTSWYLTDHLGTVRDLVNGTGTVLNQLTYDSFGALVAQTNPLVPNNLLFTGRVFENHDNLYYYRARYYDPGVGRFTSEDSIGFAAKDANLYRYAGNNPITSTDPLGETSIVERALLLAVPAAFLGSAAAYACGGSGKGIVIAGVGAFVGSLAIGAFLEFVVAVDAFTGEAIFSTTVMNTGIAVTTAGLCVIFR